jgi:signal transduction histidine kinase
VRGELAGTGCKELRIVARAMDGGAGVPARILLVIEDLGDRSGYPLALAKPTETECLAARPEELLSILSHELRNPLAPIMHAAAFLSHVRGLEPAALEAAAMITRKSEQMARLLDDLLDASKLCEGDVTLDAQLVDLRAVLHRAIDATRPLLEARRHELSVSVPREPLVVKADPKRLQQVLGNLLGNAAKYTPPGGYIRVDAIIDGEFALLRVKDSGVGISPEMLPRIFGLFTQADHSLARTGAGLGVGLSVVQRLVQLHGGTVEAHSDGEGKGSDFIVRWPLGFAPR